MRKVKFKTSYTDELIFGTVQETADYIDIDGYSNARNIKEAYKQLGNALEPYDKENAEYISKEVYENYKTGDNLTFPPRKDEGPAQFILEFEKVPLANNQAKSNEFPENHTFGNKRKGHKLKGYEINENMESADAKWYLHVRIPK